MVNDGLIMDRYGYAYTILHDMMDNNMVKKMGWYCVNNGLTMGSQWLTNGWIITNGDSNN